MDRRRVARVFAEERQSAYDELAGRGLSVAERTGAARSKALVTAKKRVQAEVGGYDAWSWYADRLALADRRARSRRAVRSAPQR